MNKYTIVILIGILFFITNSYYAWPATIADRQTENLKKPLIITLTPSVGIGSNAKFLLLLPPFSDTNTKLRVHFDNQVYPIDMTQSYDKYQEKIVEFPTKMQGRYTVVLVTYDLAGKSMEIAKDIVAVNESTISKVIGSWGGPVLGAFLAVVIFIIQDLVKNMLNKNKIKNNFICKVSNFIKHIDVDDLSELNLSNLPDWLEYPFHSDWNNYQFKSDFQSIVNRLYSLCNKIKEHAIDLSSFKNEINDLKLQIKNIK